MMIGPGVMWTVEDDRRLEILGLRVSSLHLE